MSVLILGGKGNMGQRYQAVLKHLGVRFAVADVETSPADMKTLAAQSEGIIIATPTDTHTAYILSLAPLKKPILCEKPICKDPVELRSVLHEVKTQGCPFSMVYQYGMLLTTSGQRGLTFYDYFKHGSDGLAWDCIQVIGLARGDIKLEEESPIWRCAVNGERLHLGQMDKAYIEFIRRWMREPKQDLGALVAVHEKAAHLDRINRENAQQYH